MSKITDQEKYLCAKRGYGWETNPWVVALTFTVHQQNIDQMP